eukprot:jgi/Undpi1/10542/HiC_scaffold_29.g12992.m1
MAHHAKAKWQTNCHGLCLRTFEDGDIVIETDFIEKYTHVPQADLTCARHETTTLMVAIVHFCPQTWEGGGRVHLSETWVFASADPTHDFDFHLHALKQIADYYLDGEGSAATAAALEDGRVPRMHMFTDGCAKQYKGRRNFRFLSSSVRELGFIVEHHFAATSHFKGCHDGIGGVIKNAMRNSERLNKVITGAAGVVKFVDEYFAKIGNKDLAEYFATWSAYRIRRVHAKLIEFNAIYRPTRTLQGIKGTRDIYVFVGVNKPRPDASTSTRLGRNAEIPDVVKKDWSLARAVHEGVSNVDAKPGSGVDPGISANFENIDGGDVVSNHPVTSSATIKGETVETLGQKRDTDLSREHAPFDGCSERGAVAVAAVEACAEGVNQVEESGRLAGAAVLAAAEVADETASITVVVEEGEEEKGVEKTVEETTPASGSDEESKPSWTHASFLVRADLGAVASTRVENAERAMKEAKVEAAKAQQMTEQNAAITDENREIEGNQQILRVRSRMAWRSCHEELLVATKARQELQIARVNTKIAWRSCLKFILLAALLLLGNMVWLSCHAGVFLAAKARQQLRCRGLGGAVSSQGPAKEGSVAGQGVCGGERRKEEKEGDDKREEKEKEKKDEEEQEEERERGAAARDGTVVREESPINAPGVYESTNVAAATARAAGSTPAPSAAAVPPPAPAPAPAAALAADSAAGCGASPSMDSRKVHFKVEIKVGCDDGGSVAARACAFNRNDRKVRRDAAANRAAVFAGLDDAAGGAAARGSSAICYPRAKARANARRDARVEARAHEEADAEARARENARVRARPDGGGGGGGGGGDRDGSGSRNCESSYRVKQPAIFGRRFVRRFHGEEASETDRRACRVAKGRQVCRMNGEANRPSLRNAREEENDIPESPPAPCPSPGDRAWPEI